MPGGRMRQAVWSGSINFGLVSIPVRLYPATDPKDVRFHLYDRRTGKRVHYEGVTRADEPMTFRPERSSGVSPEEPAESGTAGRAGPTAPAPVAPAPLGGSPFAPQAVEMEDVMRGLELPGGDLVTVTEAELAA